VTAAWVAGTVRGRALARRRVGPAGARTIARSAGLEEARTLLAGTPYGGGAAGPDLAGLQHQVVATLVWHLRVLAGWLPREGSRRLRLLAGGLEIANVDEHLHGLAGGPTEPPYRLGTLQTAWPRVAAAPTAARVREVLASSPWGDPGPAGPGSTHVVLVLAWAQRVVDGVPGAEGWARGAAALVVTREALLAGTPPTGRCAARTTDLLGAGFTEALAAPGARLPDLTARLPRDARWALTGVQEPRDLWRAEAGWWHRVERDAARLLRTSAYGPGCVLGVAGVLAADAWRVRAALGAAARGTAAREVFDGLA